MAAARTTAATGAEWAVRAAGSAHCGAVQHRRCLLYTSDAADERSSVDLGGRRIIKKKKTNKHEGVNDQIETYRHTDNLTRRTRKNTDKEERNRK